MNKKTSFWVAALMACIGGAGSCEKSGPQSNAPKAVKADLVLRGGKIATIDKGFSIQQAIAVQGDKIIFVGSDNKVEQYIGRQTRIIELEGKLALPGLMDCQGHMHDLGERLNHLDISGAGDFTEIIEKVAEKAKNTPPGRWIIGQRWDQNDWSVKEFPTHNQLSKVTPDNPVFLFRVDGHSALVNQKALEMAGIDKNTPNPYGGVIVRQEDGQATGVLINRAMTLVEKMLPVNTDEQYRQKFMQAVDYCLALGLTSWQESGVTAKQIDFYKELIDKQQLKMRVYAIMGEQENLMLQPAKMAGYLSRNRINDYGGNFLAVRCTKLFFDGSLGSRGAAFFEPYADDPDNLGLLRVEPEYIYQAAKAALESGMSVTTHCIGTRANSLGLDAYERALRENPHSNHRFRIEHAEVVRDEDISRFARLKVLPVIRPSHCILDMKYVEERIGPQRAAGAFAWRKFLDAGCILPCGSDFPVVSPNPLLGIYAAITRQDTEGQPAGGWFGQQRMTMQEALKGYTIWAAYSAFQEEVLGSLEGGKLADIVVLDTDILSCPPPEILSAKVIYTIVGGKIVYQKNLAQTQPQ